MGHSAADDRAGGVPRGVDISRAGFYSYLTYSTKWNLLPESDRSRIKHSLPVSRTTAPEPGTSGGHWRADHNYSYNGTGVSRGTFNHAMKQDLFDEEIELPSRTAQQRLDRLVGLEPIKQALATNATVLLDPAALQAWVNHCPRLNPADRRQICRANAAVRSRWGHWYWGVHSC